ncbi:hypothetical protein D3C76_1771710 [compost metagenome]
MVPSHTFPGTTNPLKSSGCSSWLSDNSAKTAVVDSVEACTIFLMSSMVSYSVEIEGGENEPFAMERRNISEDAAI